MVKDKKNIHLSEELYSQNICNIWYFCVQNTIKRWNVDQTKDHCVYRSLSPIQRGFVNYKKGELDSQPQVIKFTSCLPKVGGSLRVLGFLHH
jgi:hypothetical protein